MVRTACCRFLIPLAFFALVPLAAFAQTTAFNLPAQPLADSLKAVGSQTGLNIMVSPPLVDGKLAPPIKATMSARDALARLLIGTKLEYHFVNDQTVIIRDAQEVKVNDPPIADPPSVQSAKSPTQDTTKETGKNNSQDFRVAQVDQATAGHQVEQIQSNGSQIELEEVVVTAQKREERLQDVPISIAVVTSDELQKREAQNIDDLALAVPGLGIQSSGSYQRRLVLRGISNLSGSSSLIGLYLDDADVTSNPNYQLDLRTYDSARVEVLRGPQGTLYGEGSVGGTVRFITNDPLLDRFAMNADVAALFTQDGAPSQRIESVVNLPLIPNELGLRVAGTFDHEGGWIDQPAANQTNYNDQNVADVRTKVLWQPAPEFTVNAMALIHRNEAPPNLGEDANGNYTQLFDLTTTPSGKDAYDVYNLTLAYNFPWARLLSTTSYIDQNKDTRNYGIVYQAAPLGTPSSTYDEYYPSFTASYNTTNEELRLTSIGEGPWQWTLGGFYRYFKTATDVPVYYFALPGPPGSPLPPGYSYESANLSRSAAGFGDTSYKIADRLTLGAGLRYFEDEEGDRLSGQTAHFHATTPRAYLDLKLAETINAYASAAKGFRSGGFNQPLQPTYGPESVWTYELGTKMSALENHVSADVDIFDSSYSDYQVFGVLPPPAAPVGVTSNAGHATIKGIEWALTWRPAPDWSLTFDGDYLVDYKFTELNTVPYAPGVPSTAYAAGDALPLVQKHTFAVSAERDFNLSGKAGFLRLDYAQSGRETYQDRSVGPWYHSESDIINMLNFNARIHWNENLALGVFCQNLLNDRGYTDPFSIEDAAARARPRTYGVDFGVTF